LSAQVKTHHGSPALFLDGKPAFAGLMCGASPEPDSYILSDCARLYAEAGIHLFAFGIGTLGAPPEWCGPGPGRTVHYDFSTLEQRLNHIILSDPQARFHFRVHIEMPAWWQAIYPGECEIGSDGKLKGQSYASSIWRAQVKDFFIQLITHLQHIGMADRVLAYQPLGGGSGEWVKGETNMASLTADYSEPMRAHFRNWLRQAYSSDPTNTPIEALRTAWNQPHINFETVEVPPAAQQLSSTHGVFRHPSQEQWTLDYFHCLSDLVSDLIIDYCATIKQAAGKNVLTGAFYGYLLDLAWNAGFFGEGADSGYSTYQRSGHLGLRRVLASPDVDFLVSPYSYGFRGIGGHGASMIPTASARLHGKLVLVEDDTRTHTFNDPVNFGKVHTVSDSFALLKRNLAYVLTENSGIWWGGGSGTAANPETNPAMEPAYQPLLRRFQEIGTFATTLERQSAAQIAVLLDDESLYYESCQNDLDVPLIFQQRLWGLPRLGAPIDTYLLQDLIEDRLPPYPLYIFLNAFHLNRARRNALKQQLQRAGSTALWIYAPGYLAEEPSLEAMTDLTGFTFAKGDHPWGPLMHLTDLSHPITQGLPVDLTWGTNARLSPIFHLQDPAARILGNVVYSQGRCCPGFAVKQVAGTTSIYSAAPNLPAPLLRGIARFAGVHLYNNDGDVLYASRQLLGVHTAPGGERVYHLPHEVESVYDLFEQKTIANRCTQFQVTLEPRSTRLFYFGRPVFNG
jgi:hypothetical protein